MTSPNQIQIPVFSCDDCGRSLEAAKVDAVQVYCTHCGGRAYRVPGPIVTAGMVEAIEGDRVTARASSLGLGSFPSRIPTTLGNGADFYYARRDPVSGTRFYSQLHGRLVLRLLLS